MTIDLIDCGTRFLVTLESGWGVKFNRSEAQEVVDLLAEQGVHATLPEMDIEAVSRFAKAGTFTSDTQATRPESMTSKDAFEKSFEESREVLSRMADPAACRWCWFYKEVESHLPAGEGYCHLKPDRKQKDNNHWCGQFKRGKEGLSE